MPHSSEYKADRDENTPIDQEKDDMRNQPSNGKRQDHPADENRFEDSREAHSRNANHQRQRSDDHGYGRILAAKMLRQCDGAEEQDPQRCKLAEQAVIRISRNVGESHVFSFQLGVVSRQCSVGSQERLRIDRMRPLIMAESLSTLVERKLCEV